MRATATVIALSLVAVAWGAATTTIAAPYATTVGPTVAAQLVGQFSTPNSQRRQEADQLLRQAREALAQNKFELAEELVSRAEKTGAKYDAIFARFVDTPEKVRQDIQARRKAAESVPNPPDNLYAGSPGGAPPIARTGYNESSQEAVTRGGRFPVADSASEEDSAAAGPAPGAFPGGPEVGGEVREQGAVLLYAARRAVANGDLAQAQAAVASARQLGVMYPLNADSPEKVEGLLREAQRLSEGPADGGNREEHQQQYARHLLDQAEHLLLYYEDIQHSERLARQAQAMPVQYGPFERTPDQLLTRIAAAARDKADGGNAGNPGFPPAQTAAQSPGHPRKAEASRLLATAAAALDRGDTVTAQRLVQQVESLQVPPDAFGPSELRPWEVAARVQRAIKRLGGVAPAVGLGEGANGNVEPGVYRPAGGPPPGVMLTQGEGPAGPDIADPTAEQPAGFEIFQQGMRALANQDREAALRHFREAWKYEQQLDPATRQQLKDKLTLLRAAGPASPSNEPSPLQAVDAQQQLLRQKLYREITAEQEAAEKMVADNDPRGALARLNRLRDRVASSELDDPASRKQLLTLVDRTVESLEQYIERNRGQIELDERNRQIKSDISLDRQRRLEMQDKLAELVEKFNQLLDEQRYPEAEVVAKQARELDPDNPVVQNLSWKSRFIRRFAEQQAIQEESEAGFYGAITSVQASGAPFDDREPYVIGDAKRWRELTRKRRSWLEGQRSQLSPAELEIQKSMKNMVEVRFSERPLAEVLETLSDLSGVPIYLDPRGLAAEGVTTDTPVTIRLSQEISLQSALNLILEPLRLSYIIQNEVLRVTSEQTRDSEVYPRVYNVADLVVPIPNFIPSYNVGLPGAIKEAHNAVRQGLLPSGAGAAPLTLAANDLHGQATTNASVLAQMGATGMLGSTGGGRPTQPMGPGGLGGGVQADFDSLIELITSTIAPQSWDAVGGPGAIQGFETNLSLVVSQTQEIHEQIADLLEQLRRLQDLQVTIEVRFITLSDNFFERIGIDFDFDIDDNTGLTPATIADIDDVGPSLGIGLDPTGAPTTDLDLSFIQDSFAATVPQFGGFDPASAANFGFAILSDIEVFFLLQAAQGDTRSNVLQAPKVTLFNGQNATVSDTAQRPFVTSVIPVVGDFAAAHQPVIVVLSEGTTLSVQAVVSADRRFVRLTLVPFFSRIGDVEEFTFNGRTTSETGTDIEIDTGNDNAESRRTSNNLQVTEGTTVQLPTFAFTTVTTTVSVPDGGTVLLGGIKRLREGRNEQGVPLLSKVPYVNRLFRNVGIGRETQSLMMMVTPRIIIQEEEEEKLGIDIEP